jgi:hypothetical protein
MSTIAASTTTTTAYTVTADTTGALVLQTGATPTTGLTLDSSQYVNLPALADPTAPSAGNLKTFAKTIGGGYTAPAFLNATNAAVQLQPAFANKRISTVSPLNGSSSISYVGNSSFASLGTATGISVTTTNLFTRAVRVNNVSAGTAGSLGGFYTSSVGVLTLGTATTPAYGGFYYVVRFGIADTVASPRTFVGLTSSFSAPTNVEPSTLTNVIGVGQGAADTNLKIYYGGSAAQTPIDLGANFPTGTSATDWYELTLFAPPTSNNTVYYQVTRLNTGDKASGTLTGTAGTVLPANTTRLASALWRSNNATASAVTLSVGNIYTETDY